MELELDVDLFATMGRTLDRLDRRLAQRQAPSPSPVFYTVGQHIVIANNVGELTLDGPDQGTLWYVRSIVVGGLDPTIAAAGVADIFVTAADLTGINTPAPSLLDWRDRAASLPSPAFYGRGELALRSPEMLYVRFSGATNAQDYACAIRVEVLQEHAGPQEWSL